MTRHIEIRKNTYLDSVSLMSMSTRANAVEGVTQALLGMATPMNKEVLANVGVQDAAVDEAKPSDLMIVIDASEDTIGAAIAAVDDILTRKDKKAGEADEVRYRTLDGAFAEVPDANLVLISVNGAFAAREARKALNAGKSVMIFSDNVSVEDELSLKNLAHEKGLIVMGPDCGTAIIGGTGLAFANAVRRGSIGVVGASGTGSQEVSVRVHDFGGGISQLIGTGGRDLSTDIGGISMIDGITALDADPETKVIVLISKPPAEEVAEKVLAVAGAASKPVFVTFLGSDRTESGYENVTMVTEGTKPLAIAAVVASGIDESTLDKHPLNIPLIEEVRAKLAPEQKYVRGLFCGGTLCDESMFAALGKYDNVYSNIQKDPAYRIGATDASREHTFLDMGDDDFTNGRPHPMIDPSLRLQRIVAEADDPEVGVIAMDFVLGFGSHEDPVGVTIPAITEAKEKAAARGQHLEILGYVLGTDLDTPAIADQVAKLEAAGVTIASSSTNLGLLAREFVAKGDN
ncbi:acyl-CoA synthetase FdrA [Microbacterium sp. KUDC0406]|uniref:acyl-CoA synthetase FdrA n=1 Tax=Microbacterium sp. KUDC0406 TaxID=2909588 RepID=UPI001F2F06D6|nr:acyl-CoA synthetase FdrA [Microbacterium sp. KUDC0406]UJP11442.1 acyl-CoA synthetase FdrA [Microbacterium sp. KUDC0406]